MKPSSIISGNGATREVTIDGEILSPIKSQQVYNHSPDGFSWGYNGSGPAQLALALLLEATNEDEAIKFYQSFKFDIISDMPENFALPAEQIYEYLEIKRETTQNKESK